jgi:DNA cross-link repair 1A protein
VLTKENKTSGGLFLEDEKQPGTRLVDIKGGSRDDIKPSSRERAKTPDDDIWENWGEPGTVDRFNESEGSIKRRKVETTRKNSETGQRKGPFIDESDSEEDDNAASNNFGIRVPRHSEENLGKPRSIYSEMGTESATAVETPSLVRAATRDAEEDRDDAVADDFEDIDDELEGEDFTGRPWIEEEAMAFGMLEDNTIVDPADDTETTEGVPTCPICETSLGGLSDSVSILDGPAMKCF